MELCPLTHISSSCAMCVCLGVFLYASSFYPRLVNVFLLLMCLIYNVCIHGRRLRGTGGTAPQKNLRLRDSPCIGPPPPAIFGEVYSVIGCVAKYELTKKGVIKECFLLK